MKINTNGVLNSLIKNDVSVLSGQLNGLQTLKNGTGKGADLLGWLHNAERLLSGEKQAELALIEELANEIRRENDVLIVVGIGGSSLGAESIYEAMNVLQSVSAKAKLDIFFTGNNLSDINLHQLLEKVKSQKVCIAIISKSGTTMEPISAFKIIYQTLNNFGTRLDVVVITDSIQSYLLTIAKEEGWKRLSIPSDIGGRYSVMTAVGLFPLAVMGIDIKELLSASQSAITDNLSEDIACNPALQYSYYRQLAFENGKLVEFLAVNHPSITKIGEWWQQLFGESQGKNKMGIFPVTGSYTRDLHSIGQFLQDGNPIIFETLLNIDIPLVKDFQVPDSFNDNDTRTKPFSGKTFHEMNQTIAKAVTDAHTDSHIPVINMSMQEWNCKALGELYTMLMISCAIGAYSMDINPCDQPGVEAYKQKAKLQLSI